MTPPDRSLHPRPARAQAAAGTGFTLVELMLAVLIGALMMGAVTLTFSNVAFAFRENTVYVGGQAYAEAPAYSQVFEALQCQVALQEAMEQASSVFVLGGAYEKGPDAAAPVGKLPDGASALSSVPALADMRPSAMTSATQFRGLLGQLAGCEAQDFSIYVMQGKASVYAVVHCRRTDYTDSGMTTYTVNYFANGTFMPSLSYSFAIPTNSVQRFAVQPGATHFWLRRNSVWGINDELGAQVVFPDPTALPYELGTGGTAYSRFVLFIPTQP